MNCKLCGNTGIKAVPNGLDDSEEEICDCMVGVRLQENLDNGIL